jgi:hypothetical protein
MKSEKENQGSDGPVQVSFGDQYMPYHGAWLRAFEGPGLATDGGSHEGRSGGWTVCYAWGC